MKILLVGNAGSGKTTVRLMLRSMMPQYRFYHRNMEGNAWIYDVGGDPVLTPDIDFSVARVYNQYPNVVFVLPTASDVVNVITPDLTVRIFCETRERINRILLRTPFLPRQDVVDFISKEEPFDKYDMTIINTHSRQQLNDEVCDLVSKYNLRPHMWDGEDLPKMRSIYS